MTRREMTGAAILVLAGIAGLAFVAAVVLLVLSFVTWTTDLLPAAGILGLVYLAGALVSNSIGVYALTRR